MLYNTCLLVFFIRALYMTLTASADLIRSRYAQHLVENKTTHYLVHNRLLPYSDKALAGPIEHVVIYLY